MNSEKTIKNWQLTKRKPFALLLSFALCFLTLLTGCVRYDVGVNFKGQHQGAIVQHIKLGEQLTNFSNSEIKNWLTSVEKRAKQLQGKIKRISSEEMVVTIPFSNAKELASKFNQFFNPTAQNQPNLAQNNEADLVNLNSEMSLSQSNLLFIERNRLNLNIDLRALGVLSEGGSLIVSPGSLIDLSFGLNTPWGAKNLDTESNLPAEISPDNLQMIWHLQPGQINHIEVVFWVPSYLGIGSLLIILLVWVGFSLKYPISRKMSVNL
jgi:Protein of unknown function (DUF3153)